MAISANHFFIAIATVLAAILLFFKPTKFDEPLSQKVEIAELELRNFTLYEVGLDGLKDIMVGKEGYRFKNRFEVKEIDYTDSTRKLQNNLKADFGRYNNKNLITLKGNVRYHREDGVHFVTDRAIVHQHKETITTVGPFKMDRLSDEVVGKDLFYDTKKGHATAKQVTGVFQLQD